MIITCPNCSTRYLVAEDKIGDQGRRVRCAKCDHIWFQDPTPSDVAEPDVPGASLDGSVERPAPPTPPPPPPPPRTPETEALQRSQMPVPATPQEPVQRNPFGFLGIPVIILILGVGAFLMRDDIMRLVRGQPSTSTVTEASTVAAEETGEAAETLPVDPNLPPVEIKVERSRLATEEGMRILTIWGTVRNPAEVEQAMPELTFDLLDKNNQVIDRWTFNVPFESLAGGESEDFVGMLRNPPEDLATLSQKALGQPAAEPDAAPSDPAADSELQPGDAPADQLSSPDALLDGAAEAPAAQSTIPDAP